MHRLDPASLGRHLDAMYRAAWALCGSRDDAEDLVQETCARVLARSRVVRGDERAYLLQALRNTFASSLRTRSRRPTTAPVSELAEPAAPPGSEPEELAQAAEILAAVAELPEDLRLALVAVDIVGLAYAEAARMLGTREATITSRLYRARQRIAERFSDAAPTPAPGKEPTPTGVVICEPRSRP